MKKIIINANIFDGNSILHDKAVVINQDKVESIVSKKDIVLNDYQVIDLGGMLLAPAFVDLQINGGGGVLLTEKPTIESLRIMAAAHLKYGVMYTLPTLISTDLDTVKKAVEATKKALKEDIGVLGLHLEGPFLFAPKAGIHEKQYIHDATIEEIDSIYNESDGAIKMITVAPEACSIDCLKHLLSKGGKVFIGHTNTTCETAKEYFNSGVAGSTHIYNAMSQLGSREPGVVGASMVSDIYSGIVCDGFHVNFDAVKIAIQIKKDKIYCVTDAMPPVGYGDMDFKIGDVDIHCRNNQCLSNDDVIAGSALNINQALKNLVNKVGINLPDALKMTSTYQANMLGMQDVFGYIKAGCNANFVVLDAELNVTKMIKNGEIL